MLQVHECETFFRFQLGEGVNVVIIGADHFSPSPFLTFVVVVESSTF